MTLPKETPQCIHEVLEQYRHGTLNQEQVRVRIAELVEVRADVSAFVVKNLKWLDYDDSVEWS